MDVEAMGMTLPRILLLGAPGAGKGTQSARLTEAYGIAHITTGDVLRENRDMETAYGTPREYMEAGELVPDPVVNEIVKAAVEEADGFVLDGYPRNLEQVSYLEETTSLDVVLYLDVGEEELVSRLTGRRVCEECGKNYHVEYDPPADSGVCDACGGAVIQRDDDAPETVKERIRVFKENTEPVIEYYDEQGSLVRIDGEQSPDAVWSDVKEVVESLDR